MNGDVEPQGSPGGPGMAPPPGWFADPTTPAQLRYWDGETWTASVAPAPPPVVPGAPWMPGAGPAWVAPTNGFAIASLVCSLLAFVLCGLPAILGVVFGHVARRQIRESGGRQVGDGLALGGLIVGYLMLAFFAFVFIAIRV